MGGVERVFDEVSKRLARRGHEVSLLCSSPTDTPVRYEDGVRFIRVRRKGTLLRAPIAGISEHLPKDADIVHVAATYPFTTPSVLRQARDMGIPSVLDFHFEPSLNTAFGKIASEMYRYVGPTAYPLAETVLLRSTAYGRRAKSLQSVPESRWRIVPNGIDPERFNPDVSFDREGYLLFVGRLVPYKGLEVLLHALAKSQLGHPLVIAGDGPLRGRLEALAKHLRVDVDFLGHVSDDELPSLYRGARLTVLPSVNGQEAFGISLIESMACGTPVVASGLPGVAEVAQNGGYTATPGDPDALAIALRRALEPGRLPRGAELASKIHARYSWDAVTDRLVSVYDEVLSGAARARTNPPNIAKRISRAHTRDDTVL